MQSIIDNIIKDYFSIIKITAVLLLAVLAGCLLPHFFNEETVAYLKEINSWLTACLQGKETFVYSGFFNNVLSYGGILIFLWLIGCNRISAIPSVLVLVGYGLLGGIVLKTVFSLGFAYGILLFVLNILPGNIFISLGLIFQVNNNLNGVNGFAQHTYCFFISCLSVIFGCFYISFAGPKLLNVFLNLI